MTAYAALMKTRILAVATDLFLERGFHQTSIHAICSALNKEKGAMYRYFSSKSDLIICLIQQVQQHMCALPPQPNEMQDIVIRCQYLTQDKGAMAFFQFLAELLNFDEAVQQAVFDCLQALHLFSDDGEVLQKQGIMALCGYAQWTQLLRCKNTVSHVM